MIIGLPCAGKKEVARILAQHHGCKLLQLPDEPTTTDNHKQVSNLCFEDYQGKAVFVMEKCSKRAL